MGVFQALSHRSRPVSRLLELGQAWPAGLPEVATPAEPYRVARQLTPEEVDALVEQYRAGQTVYELAAVFGIHRATVGQHLRARGVDTTPPGLRPEDVAKAAELYRAGWSLARLSQRFGTTDNTVRTRLVEAGVTMRARRGGRRRSVRTRDTHGRER